ncbi:MAG: chemotaxis protein CheW [Longimicrobiales bacterium]|nr:chemotaxis protein CheW [Longimicrobiales bacterium]
MRTQARESPRETLQARARRYARVRELHDASARNPVLTFLLGGERYGVEARCVLGVARVEHLTPLPSAPGPLAGLVLWRGSILTVVDLEGPLGAPRVGLDDRARVVVVRPRSTDVGGMDLGILVGDVEGILDVGGDLEAPENESELVAGRAAGALTVLNPRALPALLMEGDRR